MLKKLADTTLIVLLLSGLWVFSATSDAGPSGFTLTTSTLCEGGRTGCGTVVSSETTCKRNCIISVTANASAGWSFDHWEGDVSGTANRITVRMTSDKQVTAVFMFDAPPPQPPPSPPPPGDREVIGYFIQWGIYRRNYLVKDIVANGAADTLTVINYAFAGIGDDLTCTSLDAFADWNKRFDASESVDGVADTVAQPLKGNFNQLKKLKQRYPQIRVLISIGGWNDSDRFSDAALAGNRGRFVASCVDMFINGRFDPANGVVDSGVFDGIDIDWEYPGACGATCNWRAEDATNFTALLAEFRSRLDAVDPPRHFLLTAATPASSEYHDKIDLPSIADPLDWMNLMAYDFHGSWEPYGPTNHQSNLYAESDYLSGDNEFSVATVVNAYRSKGVHPSKITVGLPFYGRGWGGVADGGTHGLYQSAGRIPRGTWERGIEDYKMLKTKGYPEYWDNLAKASWYYDGNTFWTFDSPLAIQEKMHYISGQNLNGVMLWELSGDNGKLVGAIADCLDPKSSTCQ